MKLTIGICGLVERLPCLIIDKVKSQLTDEVELILCFDNRHLSLGAKRNLVLGRAKGEFITFIDDDDDISDDYVSTLLNEIKTRKGNFDVLTFRTAHYKDGMFNKFVKYSTTIGNRERDDYYVRWANAICCWRLETARSIGYSDITFGEDSDFGHRANKKRVKEVSINNVLYHHLWSSEHSTGESFKNEEPYQLTNWFPQPDMTKHLIICHVGVS